MMEIEVIYLENAVCINIDFYLSHENNFHIDRIKKVIELKLYFYIKFHKISIFLSRYFSSKIVNICIFVCGCFERISKHPCRLF